MKHVPATVMMPTLVAAFESAPIEKEKWAEQDDEYQMMCVLDVVAKTVTMLGNQGYVLISKDQIRRGKRYIEKLSQDSPVSKKAWKKVKHDKQRVRAAILSIFLAPKAKEDKMSLWAALLSHSDFNDFMDGGEEPLQQAINIAMSK